MTDTTMQLATDYLDQLVSRLSGLEGESHFDAYHRALYSTDASIYQIQPLGVVLPRSVADVQRVVTVAGELGLTVVPRGSGTSLSGQSIGPGLILDFSKYMNRLLEIDPQAGIARVEPGVVLDDLNAAAAPYGLQFGPDVATSSRANLGGMIGNNSAGARSIWYGKTVDHVISLDVVLSDGTLATLGPWTPQEWQRRQTAGGILGQVCHTLDEIVARDRSEILSRFPKLLRRVSGYNLDEFVRDFRELISPPQGVQLVRGREAERFPAADRNLARLICGSEGTLAVVVAATLHLVPRPVHRGLLVLEFRSLAESIAAVASILQADPSAIELFDKRIVQLARESLEYRRYVDFVSGEPESLMIVEISGDSLLEVRSRIDGLATNLRTQPGLENALPALDRARCDHIWACRKAALPLLMGIPGARKPLAFVEDTAVPPPRLPEFVDRFRRILHDEGTDGAYYGHASVGCMHIRPLLDTRQREDIAHMNRILERVSDLVLEFGGAMSGEHGDGLARSRLNEKMFGPQVYKAFWQLKAAFDPRGRLNPGKVVAGPAPDENLRHPTGESVLPLNTALDFSAQGGIAGAAGLCNGSAVCRKLRGGVMCPSFMATLDEEHSTRGRANALRMVLTGVLPAEELSGRRLFETFDLCLSCKGCKAECPSNVDVAKLKSEYLYHYYARNALPAEIRRLADPARWNRLGARLAPLSNWLNLAPGASWLRQRLFGIDRRRDVPQFQRKHFFKWFAARPPRLDEPERGPIALLADCLTGYCEPDIPRAAVQVLEAAGYEVRLAGIECCGRAMISLGLLDQAKELARKNLERLMPFVEKRIPILGVEPSCLLTLADDYVDLLPGDDSRKLAAHVRLLESHLVAEKLYLPLRPQSKSILLHPHCHQRAIVGAEDSRRALQMIPGVEVRVLDAGCCGMAGSFGYTHYDLSMQIGKRTLFPAVEQFVGEAIVATGFSCRQQIAAGTSRFATHPVQQLARQLPAER